MSRSQTEFYDGSSDKPFASVDAIAPMQQGSFVSIRGQTYEVVKITFALDFAHLPSVERCLRMNVEVVIVKGKRGTR